MEMLGVFVFHMSFGEGANITTTEDKEEDGSYPFFDTSHSLGSLLD